ncbi:acetoacetate decarboxylase family protein [Saccharopolyspora sp. HNM0983]|uniref:Acetoacetate decarboxylase family protein n=1 Tax=Saccharopolyspora montiporae TaxID=2781240 RepID=A0A929B5T2_9PSEU|nr:acetoacetate decarboxylase family protein [Saccharopolyspora sp. HNM0983]MBE9373739.1 acetoacetate decarboxylase family protein [Saccharopolyspora sp. HNM0983]
MSAHRILGEPVQMPVQIRSARACAATFLAQEAPVRDLLAGTGLDPVRPLPGRALCSLVFVRYTDGDLGPYHEFGVVLLCRTGGRSGSTGAYVHWLPVNQRFTLQAGRDIWGFPKELADIDASFGPGASRCAVRLDGRPVVDVRIGTGVPAPAGAGAIAIDAYTFQDRVLRRIPWRVAPGRVRVRPGGARVRLGEHPVADEIRSLGLSRTALTTTRIDELSMSFDEAQEVR